MCLLVKVLDGHSTPGKHQDTFSEAICGAEYDLLGAHVASDVGTANNFLDIYVDIFVDDLVLFPKTRRQFWCVFVSHNWPHWEYRCFGTTCNWVMSCSGSFGFSVASEPW